MRTIFYAIAALLLVVMTFVVFRVVVRRDYQRRGPVDAALQRSRDPGLGSLYGLPIPLQSARMGALLVRRPARRGAPQGHWGCLHRVGTSLGLRHYALVQAASSPRPSIHHSTDYPKLGRYFPKNIANVPY